MKLSQTPRAGRNLFFVLLFLGLALLAYWAVAVGEAGGTTLYVDDDANEGGDGSVEKPYNRIQDAVEAASQGSTVQVLEGFYEEDVQINRTMSLVGSGPGNTTIHGVIYHWVLNVTNESAVVNIRADNVSISGFTLQTHKGLYFPEASVPGIKVSGDNVRITDNHFNCTGNYRAVRLSHCVNVTLLNNSMTAGGVVVDGDRLEYWDSHHIGPDNTVNDKPLYYLAKQYGGIVPTGAGQVILGGCSGVVVENQSIGKASMGILAGYSSNITIRNNVILSLAKVVLYRSTHSTIQNNICLNWTMPYPSGYGVVLHHSDNNLVLDNNCSWNLYGIYIHNSRENRIERNLCNWSNSCAIKLTNSSNNQLIGNSQYSSYRGIHLTDSHYNLLEGNNCSDNRRSSGRGIHLEFSDNNTLRNNVCSNNTNNGIELDLSNNNILDKNRCEYNWENGIYISSYTQNTYGSRYTVLRNNSCGYNNESGILLSKSNHSLLHQNNCSFNGQRGIYVYGSSFNILSNNSVYGNLVGMAFGGMNMHWSSDTGPNGSASFVSQGNLVHNNSIMGNTMKGLSTITDKDSYFVNASGNYWGDDSGPYNSKDNPGGKGDNVSENVYFDGWLDRNRTLSKTRLPGPDDEEGGEVGDDPFWSLLSPGTLAALAALGGLGLCIFFLEPLRYFFFSHYTRLNQDKIESDIAQQNIRGRIFQFVKDNPGVCLSTVKKEMKLGYGTVVYHLEVLLRERYLRSAVAGLRKQFWTKRDFPGLDERGLTDTQHRILEALEKFGPLSRTRLCERTGLARSTLRFNISRLVEMGKLEEETEGQENICSLKLY